jgi:hypothetical protein
MCLSEGTDVPGYRWMVGSCTDGRISLEPRSNSYPRANSFRPKFVGYFERVDGVTVLRGRYAMSESTRIFLAIWFGIFAFAALLGAEALFQRKEGWLEAVLFAAALSLAGAFVIRTGKQAGASDAKWLAATISMVLRGASDAAA